MSTQSAAFALFALASGLACGACVPESSDPPPDAPAADRPSAVEPDPGAVEPVALPDLSTSAAPDSLREQIREQHAALTGSDADADPAALGRAYGELGKLLLAAGRRDEAETCFRNARALAPRDRRWPYYLGHVYRLQDDPRQAAAAFEQAREIEPNDLPTLVWLADMHLAAGDAGDARSLLDFALALEPESAAVHLGLGRTAAARGDHFRALQHFEQASTLNPVASAISLELVAAYEQVGAPEVAEAHRQRLRIAARAGAALDTDIPLRPADPLLEEIGVLFDSAAAYERLGLQAFARGDFRRAAARLRRALDREPDDVDLRHNLGTVLAIGGDIAGAREQFEQVIARAPEHAPGHFSLGILLEEQLDPVTAMARYTTAVRHDPGHAEARLRLARLLRLSGRVDDAMAHYRRVSERDPDIFEAPFGQAMALVTLGRWADARDRLAEDMNRYPGTPAFPLSLARILAAAPDASVRDARQALEIVERMPEPQQRIDFGETMAMALAANERYDEAAALQREAMEAAPPPLAERMAATLELYEAGQPNRTPWRDGEIP